ncbi:hypothetical protein N657DRAFT_631994 [Parathielavia appendiculata]|uniref:Uncharacterized protein n=1 Tax=Parathielavia appendiculata TaxID=2587402 RepID=A0AAN6U4G3_9PEZI|nr:hypothetical protein N657DRAFT_631994 [Parathielavia appendiculata]
MSAIFSSLSTAMYHGHHLLDIETAIIATLNILLTTLTINDPDGGRNDNNWNIYYHFFLNQSCHDRLLQQAKKMQALSFSLNMAPERAVWGEEDIQGCHRRLLGQLERHDLQFGRCQVCRTHRIFVAEHVADLFNDFGDMEAFISTLLPGLSLCSPILSSSPQILIWLKDVVAAARAESRTWSNTFRTRRQEYLTLGFFAGDALSLCHALQHRRVTATTVFWYRSRHNTMDPLMLTVDDYGTEGTAPVSFNVIDTSNLLDHLRELNLLLATSPLLKNDAYASLYTETLANREMALHQDFFNELIGGHLHTVSLLLVWPPSSRALGMERLHIHEAELASVLYKLYVDMFPGEALLRIIASSTLRDAKRLSLSSNTRASFVSLLSLVKQRVVTNCDRAMGALLSKIDSNETLLVGMSFNQELYLYMHLLDMYSVDTFIFNDVRGTMSFDAKWVPGRRTQRRPLARTHQGNPQAGTGTFPCYVSFQVPSWILLREPEIALVHFGMQSNSSTANDFVSSLGLELAIFKKTLSDTNHVYITKDLPNRSGLIKVPGFAQDALAWQSPTEEEVQTSITTKPYRQPSLTRRRAKVTSLSPCHFEVMVNQTVLNPGLIWNSTGSIIQDPATNPAPAFTSPIVFPHYSNLSSNGPIIPKGECIFGLIGTVSSSGITVSSQNLNWGGGNDVLIFVESMRLDLARRTIVLVVTRAVLLALGVGYLMELMWPKEDVVGQLVDGEELRLWKEMLPSWVERCGEWKHREGREYGREGKWKAPVSVEAGEDVLCVCGKGVFPMGWKVDARIWETVKGYWVRAATPPLFASALAENMMPDP